MIEQLKRLGIGTLTLVAVGLAAAAVLAPVAYLVTYHPNWFGVALLLFLGWITGTVMRSND